MHQANGMAIKSARRKRRVGISVFDEFRIRGELRRWTPSEPWVDAQFFTTIGADDRGEPMVVARVYDPSVFPPGGDATLMIRCPACGVMTPPHAFEAGICLDHAERGNWGPSPSAMAIAALQWRHLRLPIMELPPESTEALQEEIRRHVEGGEVGSGELGVGSGKSGE